MATTIDILIENGGNLDVIANNAEYLSSNSAAFHTPCLPSTFDDRTNGEGNQSIILKLYEPLPSTVSTLETVTVEKEILVTQKVNIRTAYKLTNRQNTTTTSKSNIGSQINTKGE
mgnify:CR=1 FL=1